MEFYKCAHCGNIIVYFKKAGCDAKCCGETMDLLEPNTTDAANEKHVPVVAVEGQTVCVKVGEVAHPMLPAHYIEWIVLETDKGYYKRTLNPGEVAEAKFVLAEDEKAVAAYEFCNLHGLWKKEI